MSRRTILTVMRSTVTLHEADVPSGRVAVIVARPSALAVTRPVVLTEATRSALDDQATVLFAFASAGVTVAVSWSVSPAEMVAVDWSSEIPVALIGRPRTR